MYPDPKGTPAGRFLSYILTNMHQPSRVQKVKLLKNELSQFQDYPDGDEDWSSNVRRCERFDPDDKKWVALAVRFRTDTGADAPIVNAADECWLAFEAHLEAAGVKLETLCRDERQLVE